MASQTKKIVLLVMAGVVTASVGLAIALKAAEKKPSEEVASVTNVVRTNFTTTIHSPEQPRVVTGQINHAGERVTVSCASCHTTTKPNPALRDAAQLKQFHQGMTFKHGELSCLSCHNRDNYDALQLANGSSVEFSNVMQLCGQCHGPQLRDYRNGAHGGMNGFWDLTQGPRQRNNCTDCHDPHSPAYPVVMPVFAPAPAEREPASSSHSAKSGKH